MPTDPLCASPDLTSPAGLPNIQVLDGGLEIRVRWGPPAPAAALMALGAAALGFAAWFSHRFGSDDPALVVMIAVFVGGGLALDYLGLVWAVNRTVLRMVGDEVQVGFTPLPWFGRTSTDLSAWDQVRAVTITEEYQHQRATRYRVVASLGAGPHGEGGVTQQIGRDLLRRDEAEWVAAALEARRARVHLARDPLASTGAGSADDSR